MIPILLLASAALAASPRLPARLEPVKNERLSYVLMNMEVLRETSREESKALRVRVIGVGEQGECDGSPDTCPKTELFIAASEFDEYPEQRVFAAGKRHAWRFVRWTRLPESDGSPESGADKDYRFYTMGPAEDAAREAGHEDVARLIHEFQPNK